MSLSLPETLPAIGSTSHKGRKVQNYTFAFKQEVVDYARVNSIHQASKRFNVDRSSIRTWKTQYERLQQASSSKRMKGGGRKLTSEEMDEYLLNKSKDVVTVGSFIGK